MSLDDETWGALQGARKLDELETRLDDDITARKNGLFNVSHNAPPRHPEKAVVIEDTDGIELARWIRQGEMLIGTFADGHSRQTPDVDTAYRATMAYLEALNPSSATQS